MAPTKESTPHHKTLACVVCQQRKKKCDRQTPCSVCTKVNLPSNQYLLRIYADVCSLIRRASPASPRRLANAAILRRKSSTAWSAAKHCFDRSATQATGSTRRLPRPRTLATALSAPSCRGSRLGSAQGQAVLVPQPCRRERVSWWCCRASSWTGKRTSMRLHGRHQKKRLGHQRETEDFGFIANTMMHKLRFGPNEQ